MYERVPNFGRNSKVKHIKAWLILEVYGKGCNFALGIYMKGCQFGNKMVYKRVCASGWSLPV